MKYKVITIVCLYCFMFFLSNSLQYWSNADPTLFVACLIWATIVADQSFNKNQQP